MRYPEILSLKAESAEISYSNREPILYALSVGVGLGPEPLAGDLRFVYEKDLQVLPTFATTLRGAGNSLLAESGIDMRKVLHSEQRLRIHNPLPPAGHVVAANRIADVVDKGKDKGAVVYSEYAISDAETGQPCATVIMTLYCRGDGGFGGPVIDPYPIHRIPDRTPDEETALPTAANQAALFRLGIGDTTQLHIDPEFARQVGFEHPLLHGECSYGIACRAVMKAHCEDDPTRIRSFDARFAAPFFPGETLITRSWQDGDVISFECFSGERGVTVFKNGRCEIA